ncbi:hypothetical protein CRG98_004025 [Punica granatum]|uniref:Uncharacterized protein n=1 Tax=Punica granatum TaxID=22663 RepID=A0A2I0L4L4_PUNGR|nr:hypothetical protein CRG98_004025 [Punica granatum]
MTEAYCASCIVVGANRMGNWELGGPRSLTSCMWRFDRTLTPERARHALALLRALLDPLAWRPVPVPHPSKFKYLSCAVRLRLYPHLDRDFYSGVS